MARSTMRCALAFSAALAIVNASPGVHPRAAVSQQEIPAPPPRKALTLESDVDARLLRVQRWLTALLHHKPGEPDDAAKEVSAWSTRDLRQLWIDTNVLAKLIRNPKASSFSFRAEGQPRAQEIRYPPVAFRRLQVLACVASGQAVNPDPVESSRCREIGALNSVDAELQTLARRAFASRQRRDENYILRRGALLESDVGMLFVPTWSEPVSASSAPGPDRFRMTLADGQGTAFRQVGVHWELARMLLDYVKPNGSDRVAPGRDEMVRDWYRATAAWMQDRQDYDTNHLDRAREVLPADPIILFLSGSLAEAYAAPHIQSAIRSAVAPAGTIFAVGSDRAELRQAEGFYRRALAADSSLPELHLRFGHVLLLLEREADAVKELRVALDVEGDPLLRYYGELFLGAAEERLGHADAARKAYADASALYPNAQSPHIGLSALARRLGDRATAFKEMQIVFALQQADARPDDPWWTYYKSQARNADDLLESLWRPFLAEADR
jgi:tetratricopeptide (TPR) repeat protein